jgi:hypothetical protein
VPTSLVAIGHERGLWFDVEMLPFCGQTLRVRRRIERFVSDRNGKMIEQPSDCVTLEGVVCSGERSTQRWFCPRAIYSYWRECWLERVEATNAGTVQRRSSCMFSRRRPRRIYLATCVTTSRSTPEPFEKYNPAEWRG